MNESETVTQRLLREHGETIAKNSTTITMISAEFARGVAGIHEGCLRHLASLDHVRETMSHMMTKMAGVLAIEDERHKALDKELATIVSRVAELSKLNGNPRSRKELGFIGGLTVAAGVAGGAFVRYLPTLIGWFASKGG